MSKLVTFLVVIATLVLIFATSVVGVFFVHGYFRAIETQDLISQVKAVTLEHNNYMALIHNKSSRPIEAGDFDKVDERIFDLAQEDGLTAYGVSKDEHILQENPDSYFCQLTLGGNLKDIKSFIDKFTEQNYLISIANVEIEPSDGAYMAKIKYYLYKTQAKETKEE